MKCVGVNLRQSFCRLQQTSESLLILVDFPMFGFQRVYFHPIQLLSEQKITTQTDKSRSKKIKSFKTRFWWFRAISRSVKIIPAQNEYLTGLILGVSTNAIKMSHQRCIFPYSLSLKPGQLWVKIGECREVWSSNNRKCHIFTFEVLPSKVVSSFWTPSLNKLFDDFTVEVVAIRTAPAKNHFYKVFSPGWIFELS